MPTTLELSATPKPNVGRPMGGDAARRLDKGANKIQDTVLVPEEVLRDSRAGGDLPRLSFYD